MMVSRSWKMIAAAIVTITFLLDLDLAEMPPNYTFMREATEAPKVSFYDYIVVGGGTTGIPVAATLSENSSVLLLERGGSPYPNPNVTLGANFGTYFFDTSPDSPSQQFVVEGVVNARPRVLGGGTCINAGFYTRAEDRFYTEAGLTDANLIEESYQYAEKVMVFEPVLGGWQTALRAAMLEAGVTPDNGYTFDHLNGRSKPMAYGVVFEDSLGKMHRAYLKSGKKNEIIVSAGALGSPQLLILSGIGPKEQLDALKIKVVVEQPLVGQYMADNPLNGFFIPALVPVERSLVQTVGITEFGSYIEESGGINFLLADTPTYLGYDYQEPEDLEKCVKGLEVMLAAIESDAFSNYRYPNMTAQDILDLNIQYPYNQNENSKTFSTLEQYCKDTKSTIWHYHGGCRIGKVLDEEYKVLGVDGLRVMDGSTFLNSPGTNPQASLMMLGRYMGVTMLAQRYSADKPYADMFELQVLTQLHRFGSCWCREETRTAAATFLTSTILTAVPVLMQWPSKAYINTFIFHLFSISYVLVYHHHSPRIKFRMVSKSWRMIAAAIVTIIFLLDFGVADMPPNYTFMREATEAPKVSFYDYIVVGGGTTGIPLAATLSENSSVLLLERGGSPYPNPNVTLGANFGTYFLDTSPESPSQQFVVEGVVNARPRVLGGGTCINAGFYTRAEDRFYTEAGLTDANLIEESYQYAEKVMVFEPVLGGWQTALRAAMLEAGVTPDNGYIFDHLNGTKTGGSIFDPDGVRHTAADLLQYANPEGISKPVAYGVVFEDSLGKMHRAYLKHGKKNEIIVSAGALGSPQLLILSGIGPKEQLDALKIKVVVEQPLVGQYMADNPLNGLFIPALVPVERSLVQTVGITEFGSYIEESGGDNPNVTFNYFKEPEDLEKCVKGLEVMLAAIVSDAFSNYRYPNMTAQDILDLNIQYPYNLNENSKTFSTLEQYCKDTKSTIWHYHGGCRIGKVLDNEYKVLGVDGLRVMDGSTFLNSPGTNPQASLMMLGRYMGVTMLAQRCATDKPYADM
ncbi:Glucose-methanol-choline oxidoreductase, C-terminal [Cynara cardunculus var. scolymus]|uniref:Glucose-methanol-choline oxidoreductase, C-terminal n=1 Tax=Cynara cardunculus var. scolymus TaxID=59895 RepID=A0A103XIR9_CYNCS|nr:Glucose-methanol-choline oxidoreductase, C-terminal [Cynara cardunculus var. scolymus]